MKIPKKFKLMGQTITVEWDEEMRNTEDTLGKACYRTNKIIIQPDGKGVKRTKEQLEQTFLHELVHHILFLCEEEGDQEHPLHCRETLVDRVAHLLQQALNTMEY